MAGIVAGTAATLVVYPLECLKTEVAVAGLRGSLIANARQVLREEGVRGFYKGLGATVSFKVIATAVGFNLHAELSKAYRQAVDGRRLEVHGAEAVVGGVLRRQHRLEGVHDARLQRQRELVRAMHASVAWVTPKWCRRTRRALARNQRQAPANISVQSGRLLFAGD